MNLSAEKQKLKEEIQKRLNDSEWDKHISKQIIQKMYPIKKIQPYIYYLAASVFIVISLSIFSIIPEPSEWLTEEEVYLDATEELVFYEDFVDFF